MNCFLHSVVSLQRSADDDERVAQQAEVVVGTAERGRSWGEVGRFETCRVEEKVVRVTFDVSNK